MSMDTPDPDDLHESLRPFVSRIAERMSRSEAQIIQQIDMMYNLDLTEVEADDAEKFADAVDDMDKEAAGEVLEKYDVDSAQVEQFKAQMDDLQDESGNEDSPEPTPTEGSGATSNGSSPSNDEEYLTKAEAQAMIPTADEIAGQLESRMGGGEQAQGESQGPDPGTMQLLQMLAPDSGGGQAAKVGQEFQEQAMKSFIAEMRKPSLGDLFERRYYEKVLDSETVDEMYDDMMPDEPPEEDLLETSDDDSDDDDDGDSWGWW